MASRDKGPEHLDLEEVFASFTSQGERLWGPGPINCDLCLGLLRPPRGGRHDELWLPGRHLGIAGDWMILSLFALRSYKLPGTVGGAAPHSAALFSSPWASPRARLLDSDASETWVSWEETLEVPRHLSRAWVRPLWPWIPAFGNWAGPSPWCMPKQQHSMQTGSMVQKGGLRQWSDRASRQTVGSEAPL